MLSQLDNALDIAEMHKGQGAILEKVSVVTKPKTILGDKTYIAETLIYFERLQLVELILLF